MATTNSNASVDFKITHFDYFEYISPRSRWAGAWWFIRALPSLFRTGIVRVKNPRVRALVVQGTT